MRLLAVGFFVLMKRRDYFQSTANNDRAESIVDGLRDLNQPYEKGALNNDEFMAAKKDTTWNLAFGQEIATKCFESDYQDCE